VKVAWLYWGGRWIWPPPPKNLRPPKICRKKFGRPQSGRSKVTSWVSVSHTQPKIGRKSPGNKSATNPPQKYSAGRIYAENPIGRPNGRKQSAGVCGWLLTADSCGISSDVKLRSFIWTPWQFTAWLQRSFSTFYFVRQRVNRIVEQALMLVWYQRLDIRHWILDTGQF